MGNVGNLPHGLGFKVQVTPTTIRTGCRIRVQSEKSGTQLGQNQGLGFRVLQGQDPARRRRAQHIGARVGPNLTY